MRRSSSTRSTSKVIGWAGQRRSRNQPFYAAIGVDLDGRRDVLGLWAGQGGGEGAKFWMSVLTDLKNRGVKDVFFIVCDGMKGLPDSVNAVFPQAIVQACVIQLIRATLRYASRRYWDQLAKELKSIYTPATAKAAWAAFEELERGPLWGEVGQDLRRGDQADPLLDQRDRVPQRQVSPGGHRSRTLPHRAGRLKCLYLVTRGLDPKGTGQARWITRWKRALNAFAVTFADRMPAAENL